MPADYHTHTPLCKHATGEPEAYVAAAIAAGLTEYGVSDHAPCRPEPFDDWRMLESELPLYFDWIDRAKSAAGENIKVRAGLECDWMKGCENFIQELTKKNDWDYLIGSVHYLGSWDFDHPKWLGKWTETDIDTVWKEYWKTYAEMADSGLFDILAHPDLIKKFAYTPAGDLDRFYDSVIEVIAANGGVIELNTAGLYKPCAEAYPAPRFLELAASAGIGLIISSDAHASSEVARDFPKARELAKTRVEPRSDPATGLQSISRIGRYHSLRTHSAYGVIERVRNVEITSRANAEAHGRIKAGDCPSPIRGAPHSG